MATNPYVQRLREAEARLVELEARWAELNAQWTPYTAAGNYSNPTGQAILRERDAVANQIEAAQREVELAREALASIDRATAQGVATGMSPEAALEKAVADRQRAEGTKRILTYVGLGLLVLAVVAAIVYFRRKRK